MSAGAMRWARLQRVGGGGTRQFLDWLAVRVDDVTHSRWCTVQEIAAALECSVRTVHNAIAKLVRAALLRVFRRGNHRGGGRAANRYQLLVDGQATPMPLQEDWTGVYDPDFERRKARARQAAKAAADPDVEQTKPATSAGLVEGKPATPDEGETCNICSLNTANVAVSYKEEEVTPEITPPPPLAADPPAAAATHPAEARIDAPVSDPAAAARVLDQILDDVFREARPAGWQRLRLLDLTATALTAGWPARYVVAEIRRGGDLNSAHTVYGALRHRLRNLGSPPPVRAVPDPVPDPEPNPGPTQPASQPPAQYPDLRGPISERGLAAAAEARQIAAQAAAAARHRGITRPRRARAS